MPLCWLYFFRRLSNTIKSKPKVSGSGLAIGGYTGKFSDGTGEIAETSGTPSSLFSVSTKEKKLLYE